MVLLLATLSTHADPRPWSFVYDLYPEGKGNVEFEQWATWEHHTNNVSGFNKVDFREEIEIGITENFDLSFYAPSWSYESSHDRKGTRFESAGVEAILYLSKPTDWVGVGLYAEVNVGESGKSYEIEIKALFQKDIGKWSFAYNLVFETEVDRENGDSNVEGVFGHCLGVSYKLDKNWRLGGELRAEFFYQDWSRYTGSEVYAGPAISYTGNGISGTKANWWITVSPMIQLTNQNDSPDLMLRVLMGIEF